MVGKRRWIWWDGEEERGVGGEEEGQQGREEEVATKLRRPEMATRIARRRS